MLNNMRDLINTLIFSKSYEAPKNLRKTLSPNDPLLRVRGRLSSQCVCRVGVLTYLKPEGTFRGSL